MRKHTLTSNKKPILTGYFITFLAFFIWGILPIYWKQLDMVTSLEILVHRILWTFVSLLFISLIKYRVYIRHIIKTNKKLKYLFLSAFFLGTNWYLFIYAVSIDQILDASLGYYINPLVSVLLGVIFLKEKLPRAQLIAVLLAILGVLNLTMAYGHLPLISLTLALSFGFYGLVRKRINIKPIPAVTIESLILLPVFIPVMLSSLPSISAMSFLSGNSRIDLFLIMGGVVTFVPLVLYGQGVTMIPLKSVGFLQYITPTFMLLIGTLMYDEPFSTTQLISFSLIWIALILYSWSALQRR